MTTPLFADPTQLDQPDFLQQGPSLLDPESLTPQQWAHVAGSDGTLKNIDEIASVLGVAFVIIMVAQGKQLATRTGQSALRATSDQLKFNIKRMTSKYENAWRYMVQPALAQGSQLGSTANMTAAERTAFARLYSHQIFEYVNDSSADALVAAYNNQLAEKWHPDVAWMRATSGYGLDQRSMSQYIKMLSQGEGREIISSSARDYVAKTLHKRGMKIGAEESYRAQEMGKTIAWLSDYRAGRIPVDTKREWLTAEDERVCVVCGPMDHVQVDMEDQFELPNGNKIWAPGVHLNCRCTVRLSYPEFALAKRTVDWDPEEHPRGQGGQFTEVAEPAQEVAPAVVDAPVVMEHPTVVTRPQTVTAPAIVSAPATVQAPALVEAPTQITQPTRIDAPTMVQAPEVLTVGNQSMSARFFRPNQPVYAFANELKYRGGQGDAWHFDQDYEVGDVIDLGKELQSQDGETKFHLEAKELVTPSEMANIASNRYADVDQFEIFDRESKSAYHAESKGFYKRLLSEPNRDRIINQLQYSDLTRIYNLAGDHFTPSVMGTEDMIEGLKRKVVYDEDVRDAYVHYMEHVGNRLVPGGQDLAAFNAFFPQDPHVTNVLVFDKGIAGGYVDHQKNLVAIDGGRYRVRRTRIVPTKLQMGGDAPSNVGALKMVYLEPWTVDLSQNYPRT
jgi:hypothetical protein